MPVSRIPQTHWSITTSNWHRHWPKISGANPVSAKPAIERQASQMMGDKKSEIKVMVKEERKPMKNRFHGCNKSKYIMTYHK